MIFPDGYPPRAPKDLPKGLVKLARGGYAVRVKHAGKPFRNMNGLSLDRALKVLTETRKEICNLEVMEIATYAQRNEA